MSIFIDEVTMCFTTWELRDIKHMCIIGNACLDRNNTLEGPLIQNLLQLFLSWYDSHWLQPGNLPVVVDDMKNDWIDLARKLTKRTIASQSEVPCPEKAENSCDVM
jgi:hypothetical protein